MDNQIQAGKNIAAILRGGLENTDVFHEDSSPIGKWLDGGLDGEGVVTVHFSNANTALKSSSLNQHMLYNCSINIDCFEFAKSENTESGTRLANLMAHELARRAFLVLSSHEARS